MHLMRHSTINTGLLRSCSFNLSSALAESRKTVPLFASPSVAVVMLLVPERWRRVMTLWYKPMLGAEVSLISTSKATTLVVLEAKVIWLHGAMGTKSHGVVVALLRTYLRVVELVEGAG